MDPRVQYGPTEAHLFRDATSNKIKLSENCFEETFIVTLNSKKRPMLKVGVTIRPQPCSQEVLCVGVSCWADTVTVTVTVMQLFTLTG